MISLEIGETMVELSLAALEASAGDRMGGQVDRRGEGEGGGGVEAIFAAVDIVVIAATVVAVYSSPLPSWGG
jgi:hypothetical protein